MRKFWMRTVFGACVIAGLGAGTARTDEATDAVESLRMAIGDRLAEIAPAAKEAVLLRAADAEFAKVNGRNDVRDLGHLANGATDIAKSATPAAPIRTGLRTVADLCLSSGRDDAAALDARRDALIYKGDARTLNAKNNAADAQLNRGGRLRSRNLASSFRALQDGFRAIQVAAALAERLEDAEDRGSKLPAGMHLQSSVVQGYGPQLSLTSDFSINKDAYKFYFRSIVFVGKSILDDKVFEEFDEAATPQNGKLGNLAEFGLQKPEVYSLRALIDAHVTKLLLATGQVRRIHGVFTLRLHRGSDTPLKSYKVPVDATF